MRRILFTTFSFLLIALPSRAETWVKIKSPHFTVISNGTEKRAREVAVGFEQIHQIFAVTFSGLRTDSGAETIVIAPKDLDTFKRLMPNRKNIQYIGGEFYKGWEKDHVIVRLDIPDEDRNIVYHEYVHKLLHLNFTRLPLWLDEGMAEFYGNTWMRSDGIFIGAPSPRIAELKGRTLLPIRTILTVSPNSPYYRGGDEAAISMFYAESWGLTHFLTFGEGMGNGRKINAYVMSLQKGVDSQKAFEETFGDMAELEKQFSAYVSRFAFTSLKMGNLPKQDPAAFTGGVMSAAEMDANMAGFFTYMGETDMASQQIDSALKADPKFALAHENAAFLYFREGKDDDAAKEFAQAVELDPNDYLSLYYSAMLKYHGKIDADSLAQLDAAIEKVMQLNPRFAPALIVRSQIYVRQRKLQEAFNVSMQAQKLEPDRAGYLTNSAAILLLGRNYPAAVKMAGMVAAKWTNSDSAEAVAVQAQARQLGKIEQTADEKAQEDLEMEYAKNTVAAEGVIGSVQCEKSKPLELVLLRDGEEPLKFRGGKLQGVGFSDTLWYGADHFSSCQHLAGMNAVVRYLPSSAASDEKEISWLEIRDELIPSSPSSVPKDKNSAATGGN